jgi:hypothetical protein
MNSIQATVLRLITSQFKYNVKIIKIKTAANTNRDNPQSTDVQ